MKLVCLSVLLLSTAKVVIAQSAPGSDPQAVTFAGQSVAAMTGGMTISDVTLTGSGTWNGTDTGPITLSALGTDESRIDLALTGGPRAEIRDDQTDVLGRWIAPDGTLADFAPQNCWTDGVWFFPALGSLVPQPNVVLMYVGSESRNEHAVHHIQAHLYQPNPYPGKGPSPEQLSTMDFYLDASTLLPVAVTFNAHPDNDANTNLSVEIDYFNYQSFGGVNVPTHVQKYLQGSLIFDIQLTGAVFNTGLSLANFTIN
jgi:hypothetical protein